MYQKGLEKNEMTVISVSHQRVNCVILHIISCDQDCHCNNFLTMHQKGLQENEMTNQCEPSKG